MYWGDGMGAAGWWVMGFGMLVFWGVVVGAIVLLVRWATGNHQGQGAPPTPPPAQSPPAVAPPPDSHRVLDERFARGEIDEEEYRRRRDILRGG